MNKTAKRAAGLIRVSSPSQVDTHSLEAQKAEIARWCERRGYTLVHVYVDAGVSAYKDGIGHRPGLKELLQDAPQGKFDIVVVHTLDRMARNVGVMREVLRRLGAADVGFVSVTEGFDYTTPSGKMMLTTVVSASEFFSGMLGIHVEKAQRQRAELGRPVGPVGFGYITPEPGAVPQIVPDEAAGLVEAFRRKLTGASNASVADWLNTQGFKTRESNLFTAHAMKEIFSNPFYAGTIRYRGEAYPGKHEPVIPKDIFDRVQAMRHQRATRREVHRDCGVAQGRVVCARCGNAVQSDHQYRSGKPMYRERHAHDCETNNRSLMAHVVDDQIGLIFGSLAIPDDWRERMAKLAAKPDDGIDTAKLQSKRTRVVRAFMDGNVEEAEYRRRLGDIDAQIEAAHPASLPSVEEAAALFGDLPALWEEANSEERQRLVAPLIDRIYIDLQERLVAAIVP
ncbi:MAG: recombinase family protein, partial [Dehalococcoidia bacterium]